MLPHGSSAPTSTVLHPLLPILNDCVHVWLAILAGRFLQLLLAGQFDLVGLALRLAQEIVVTFAACRNRCAVFLERAVRILAAVRKALFPVFDVRLLVLLYAHPYSTFIPI